MRQAAVAGGVSNTTWSRYESGGVTLSPGIIHAVAKAFDWPTTWPEETPTATPPADLEARVGLLEDVVLALMEQLEHSDAMATAAIRDLSAQLRDIEQSPNTAQP